MSLDKTDQAIDALIHRHSTPTRCAAPKARPAAALSRCGLDDDSGVATLWASLFATDAKALDERLDALAATTCGADPRTPDQRRADGLGALAHGQSTG